MGVECVSLQNIRLMERVDRTVSDDVEVWLLLLLADHLVVEAGSLAKLWH